MNTPPNTHFDFSSPTDHVSARPSVGIGSGAGRVRRSVRSVLDSASSISIIQHRVISFVLLLILVVTVSFLLISIRKSKNAEFARSSDMTASLYPTIYTGDGYSIRLGSVPDFSLRRDRILAASHLYPDKQAAKNTWYITKDGKENELLSIETLENIDSLTSDDIVNRAKKQAGPDSLATTMTQTRQGVEEAVITSLVRVARTHNSVYFLQLNTVSDAAVQQQVVDSIQFN